MSEIVEKIQKATVRTLNQMAHDVISDTERQVVDAIGDFKSLTRQSDEVLMRFVSNLNNNFDELLDKETFKDEAVFNFETLSLVQEEELDVMVALEGMVNASRNEHLAIFISFNTRLASLFPRKRIDESTNPLDPEQIATAFQEALRPLGLDAQDNLTIYRAFNTKVLKHLDVVLNEANQVLIDGHVMADLGMEAPGKSATPPSSARNIPRADTSMFGTLEEEAFDEEDEDRPELFSMMQNLLHFDEPASSGESTNSQFGPPPRAPAGATPDSAIPGGQPGVGITGGALPGTVTGLEGALHGRDDGATFIGEGGQIVPPGMVAVPAAMVPALLQDGGESVETAGPTQAMQSFQPQEGQTVQMVDQAKLMDILSSIQAKLNASSAAESTIPNSLDDVEKLDISQSLGEFLLESQEDKNVVSAVDRQSSDIINLVNLLYEAIWQDPSVPIPIKELIGRTQITIIKVALEDVEFFNNERHPARTILNEFASAGIGWTEVEELEKDPLYQKIRELVDKIVAYENDEQLFIDLIDDFRTFRAEEAAKTRQLEQRILKATERNDRLDDIHELVTQKIEERILGRALHEFVEELLKKPFHKFMVMLVLKEGPGGNAWKQAINTIDVLLWSVQPHEEGGDRDRLATINPRLLNNLRKAFRIASIEKPEIDKLIEQLQQVQNETFHGLEKSPAAELKAVEDETASGDVKVEVNDEPETEEAKNIETDDAPTEEGKPKVRFLKAGEDEEEDETEKEIGSIDAEAPILETDAGEELSVDATENLIKAGREPEDGAIAPSSEAEDTKAPVSGEPKAEESAKEAPASEEEALTDDSPYMRQVDTLSVGVWVEFAGEDDNNTRCKLAAKINAIDKFIFVNRQGVKVVEKTKLGLARELRDGTVNIISDGLLFSRALESVIGNLRESQHEQHTGGAYQREAASEE
ncbi:MAG: DUF1631 domain-containing protein [Pseudomonadales bacterium]|nr:DUF1631 domain-containing protein [Pseudomonadales bacterium]